MTEDQIKELVGKTVHEKLKTIKEEIVQQVLLDVVARIYKGDFSCEKMLRQEVLEGLEKYLLRQCQIKIEVIFRKSYQKFLQTLNMDDN